MKKIYLFLLSILCIAIITSCDPYENEPLIDQELFQKKDQTETFNSKSSKSITVPFKATFYTIKDNDYTDEEFCSEDPYLALNHQVGKGYGTHLGGFDIIITFCGAGFDYKNGTGSFIAANGDELYVQIPSEGEIGHVMFIPEGHPLFGSEYEAYFEDPFSIIGGTGRFEGATGEGMTSSFVDLFNDEGFIPEHRTDHNWTGTLTFNPGSRSN